MTMKDETNYTTYFVGVVVYKSEVMALENKSSEELNGGYILRMIKNGREMKNRIINSIPENRGTELINFLNESMLTLRKLYQKKNQEKIYSSGGINIDD